MPKRSSSKNKKNKKTTQAAKTDIKKESKPIDSVSKTVKPEMMGQTMAATGAAAPETVTKPSDTKEVSNRTNPLAESLKDETTRTRIYAVLFGILFIALTIGLVFVGIPYEVKQTDDYKAIEERAKQAEDQAKKDADAAVLKAETDKKIAEENTVLTNFDNLTTTMTTNFGDIVIDLKHDTAPATVENFARLSFRGFYKDQSIHRMVKTDGFNVIQGGQANSGQSSEAALGGTVVDELWTVAPEFTTDEAGSQTLSNTPVLKEPALAKDLDLTQGTILYPKGLILMAKTSQANSATTQFFITLTDTRLPAQYTAFGVIRSDSFATLDKISSEVTPAQSQSTTEGYEDGAPNPAITYTITLNGFEDK